MAGKSIHSHRDVTLSELLVSYNDAIVWTMLTFVYDKNEHSCYDQSETHVYMTNNVMIAILCDTLRKKCFRFHFPFQDIVL